MSISSRPSPSLAAVCLVLISRPCLLCEFRYILLKQVFNRLNIIVLRHHSIYATSTKDRSMVQPQILNAVVLDLQSRVVSRLPWPAALGWVP